MNVNKHKLIIILCFKSYNNYKSTQWICEFFPFKFIKKYLVHAYHQLHTLLSARYTSQNKYLYPLEVCLLKNQFLKLTTSKENVHKYMKLFLDFSILYTLYDTPHWLRTYLLMHRMTRVTVVVNKDREMIVLLLLIQNRKFWHSTQLERCFLVLIFHNMYLESKYCLTFNYPSWWCFVIKNFKSNFIIYSFLKYMKCILDIVSL